MARPPKNLRPYLGLSPKPEEHPLHHRWKPRRTLVEAEPIVPAPLDSEASQTALPLDDADTPEDGDTLAMPEPPPPGPGDDLRLPNPDRWAPESGGLPRWFWLIAILVAVLVGLAIASSSSGPRANLYPEPEFVREP
jgi:hypothetical protein